MTIYKTFPNNFYALEIVIFIFFFIFFSDDNMSTMSDEIKFRKPRKELYPNMEQGQVFLCVPHSQKSEKLEIRLNK